MRVKDDSMIDTGLLNSDIVVALVNNEEAILKQLVHNENGSIALIPENSHMQSLYDLPEQVVIEGILLGRTRSYEGK